MNRSVFGSSQSPQSTQNGGEPTGAVSLASTPCYKLRRDALFIAAQNKQADDGFLHWVQARLLDAMVQDPHLSPDVKNELLMFHARSQRASLAQLRASRAPGTADTSPSEGAV